MRSDMTLKTTDSKGRITLGSDFANLPVNIVQNGRGEWVVQLVEAIPISETWLLKNKEALNLVTEGIVQAKNLQFANDPTAAKDYSWLEEVED